MKNVKDLVRDLYKTIHSDYLLLKEKCPVLEQYRAFILLIKKKRLFFDHVTLPEFNGQ